uniref:Thaumatin-like protein 1 n=1 Tax=Ananas comosus var. bracteatus TaxID=296719 RepID=A0A6V7NS63_ANACO|nr:unnamed protein product [Ananas comosus var. bracteatus]
MASLMLLLLLLQSLLPLLIFSLFSGASAAATFTIANNCGYAVWPGILSSAGSAPLATTGFALAPGEARAVDAPAGWSGRIWGRTICGGGGGGVGAFSCATGDCGSGAAECSGGGAAPPATLAEFTLDGSGGNDFYDVSLVDGYNLPMLVAPQGGGGPNCRPTGCLADLNGVCPSDLKVVVGGEGVACRSACDAFGHRSTAAAEHTCRDKKSLCFCCSLKSSSANPEAAGLPLINNTMVFVSGAAVPGRADRRSGLHLFLLLLALVHMLTWHFPLFSRPF